MLTSLHISNLAVLDEIEIELAPGFSTLTGETGTGKSMLIDALALALGARAESAVVRAGAARAEISATFDLRDAGGLAQWLAQRDLDTGEECQLRRVITREGRSRGYINAQPVPMELLRETGARLVEICGQHAHQSLLARTTQRELLDAHGGHDDLLTAVNSAYRELAALQSEQSRLSAARQDRETRRDLLSYQVGELRALNLVDGEVDALEAERLLLANAGRISSGMALALDRLYDADDGTAHDLVGHAERDIEALAAVDPRLSPIAASLGQARIHIADAAEQIRRQLGATEHDPQRLDGIEARLASIQELARKHRIEPERLGSHLQSLERELAGLAASDERLGVLDTECAVTADAFRGACARLSEARAEAGRSLATAVTANLNSLGMPDGQFKVNVLPLPPGEAGANGADTVEFLVATNAGQPSGPIARVASGGELSRLSLAIQVVAMSGRGAPTLVFDEVDAGIGGGVAEIVGQSLRRLSRQRQVLCVTHLAQVASQADHHFAVRKTADAGHATTSLRELAGDDRIEEIARMLGGVKITERTRAHAREMLTTARPRRAG